MATTKRVKKKNIKEDALVTYAVRASQWAQEHFNQVIIGVVVLVALIAVVVFTANSRQGASKQGARELAAAMSMFNQGDYQAARGSFEQVDERFGGKNALVARFYQAECELRRQDYTAAITTYDRYLSDADDFPAFRASAMLGKALCYEGLENDEQAARTLVAAMDILDKDDPRYLDAAFQAGEFFARAGSNEEAVKYYDLVAKRATGALKDRATVEASLLKR